MAQSGIPALPQPRAGHPLAGSSYRLRRAEHVPYKGGGPLTTDAIAGHVPVAIASIALLSSHISARALRALAVTSATRYAQLPNIPTVSELGVAGIDAQSWWGLLAPARTPNDIIAHMQCDDESVGRAGSQTELVRTRDRLSPIFAGGLRPVY